MQPDMPSPSDPSNELSAGSPVPDFRLAASSGGQIGPADYRGKVNLILFFVREYN